MASGYNAYVPVSRALDALSNYTSAILLRGYEHWEALIPPYDLTVDVLGVRPNFLPAWALASTLLHAAPTWHITNSALNPDNAARLARLSQSLDVLGHQPGSIFVRKTKVWSILLPPKAWHGYALITDSAGIITWAQVVSVGWWPWTS